MIKNFSKRYSIYDDLIKIDDRHFFGCPINESHICTEYEYSDETLEYYPDVRECDLCEFKETSEFYSPLCKKRFADLGLDKRTLVKIENRDKSRFINKISYASEGNRIYIDLPTVKQNITEDVFTLWDKFACVRAIFRNIRTGAYIKLAKSPREHYDKYRRVYGYISLDGGHTYSKDTEQLFDVEKREWICIWHKKNNKR